MASVDKLHSCAMQDIIQLRRGSRGNIEVNYIDSLNLDRAQMNNEFSIQISVICVYVSGMLIRNNCMNHG